MLSSTKICKGWCDACRDEHVLGAADSSRHALELMENLKQHKRLDFETAVENSDPTLVIDSLFGDARGKMFGVLKCRDNNDNTIILKGFSGQFNTRWIIPGWVPPLFDVKRFDAINIPSEKEIKHLTRTIKTCSDPVKKKELTTTRKKLSQELMQRLHSIYELHNFKQQTSSLNEAFLHPSGIPTGVGDCCAPKLLNFAAKNSLTPLGITEFYWGKTNKSSTRVHRQIYPSCKEKCEPILGFLLCGLGE